MSTQFNVKTIRQDRDFDEFKKKASGKAKKSGGKAKWAVLVIILIFLYLVATYVLPTATVTVFLNAEIMQKEFDLVLQQGVAKAGGDPYTYPAEVMTLNGQKKDTFKATGEKDMGEKASGTATLYNYTGRTSPITNKIELIHNSGKVFFLSENITIPQATVSESGDIVPGEISVNVVAAEAGEDYNIESGGRLEISILSGEIQEKIYAEVPSTSGGTSDVVRVVSQEDLDRATEDLTNELTPELKDELRDSINKTNLSLRDELVELEIINIEKSIDLDSEAEEFEVSIEVQLSALVFDEDELKKFFKDQISLELPDNTMLSKDDVGELVLTVTDFNLDKQRSEMDAKIVFKIFPQTDLESLKQEIKGKSRAEARRILMSQENVKDVRFDFSFSLSGKLPKQADKIDIKPGD